MEINDLKKYEGEFSETKLSDKILKFAKKAGVNLVYAVYVCFEVIKSPYVPIKDKALIFGALGYFISPIDIIPDFLPGGFVDDMAAIMYALKTVRGCVTKEMKQNALENTSSIFGHIDENDLLGLF